MLARESPYTRWYKKADTHVLVERRNGSRVGLVLERAGTRLGHLSDGSVLASNVKTIVLDLLNGIGTEEVAALLEGIRTEASIGDRGRGHGEGNRVSHIDNEVCFSQM